MLILLYVYAMIFLWGEMQFFMKLGHKYMYVYVYTHTHIYSCELFSFFLERQMSEQEMAAAVTSYFNEINLYLQFAVI